MDKPQLFVLEPTKISNFSYFNAKIRLLAKKYENSTKSCKFLDEVFKEGELNPKKCYLQLKKVEKTDIDIDSIINQYFEKKILEKNEKFIKNCVKKARKNLEKRKNISFKKEEKIPKLKKISPVELLFIESNFENFNPTINFSNEFLLLVYKFCNQENELKIDLLNKRKSPFEMEINFLEKEFFDFVKNSVREKKVSTREKKDFIKIFTKLNYNESELFLESFNDRYLFAEVYIHLRCGQITEAIKLIEEFSNFFDISAPEMKKSILSFYSGNELFKPDFIKIIRTKSDRFKILIYQILCNIPQITDVLDTFNDFAWYKMLHSKNQKELYLSINQLNVDECKMLLALFCKKYDFVFHILKTKNFPIIESFFVIKNLSKYLNQIIPYIEMVFSIINQFENQENKVEIINSLDNSQKYADLNTDSILENDNSFISGKYQQIYSDLNLSNISENDDSRISNILENSNSNSYEYLRRSKSTAELVAKFLVDIENQVLLSLKNEISSLNTEIVQNVIEILKNKNNQEILLQLYYLFDDRERILEILNEYLTDLIFKEKKDFSQFQNVVNFCKKNVNSFEKEKMICLIEFINFTKFLDIKKLKNSKIFNDPSKNLLFELKPIISKLLSLIIHVINQNDDLELGTSLFSVCNLIGLGERCRSLLGERLVMML